MHREKRMSDPDYTPLYTPPTKEEVRLAQKDKANRFTPPDWKEHSSSMAQKEYWTISEAIRLGCELHADWPGPFTLDRFADPPPMTDEVMAYSHVLGPAKGEHNEFEEKYYLIGNRALQAIQNRELIVQEPESNEEDLSEEEIEEMKEIQSLLDPDKVVLSEQELKVVEYFDPDATPADIDKMQYRVTPKEFVNWMSASGISVPAMFRDLVEKKKNPGKENATRARRDSTYLGYLVLIEKNGIDAYYDESNDEQYSLSIDKLAADLDRHRELLEPGINPLTPDTTTRQFNKMCQYFDKSDV